MIVTLVHRETRRMRSLTLPPDRSLAAYMAEDLPAGWAVQSTMTPETVLADLRRANEEEAADGK